MDENKSSQNEKPIFAYDNYRVYLQDTYHARKIQDKKFSFRHFARVAGFKSGSFLKLVMDGKSNLSLESIEKFSKALKHTKAEAEFFRLLVLLNQSTSSEEKQHYSSEILKLRSYRKIQPLSESLFKFISCWYFVVIKEMVALPDFQEDPHWISAKLESQVTVAEVRRAIDEMISLGILGRDENGKLVQEKSYLMTANEVVASSAAIYHREMMKKASESIDKVPRSKRELSALTLGVSPKTVSKIKEMVQRFREELMEVVVEDPSPQAVYQINLQFFPLVESDELANQEEA